MSDKNKQLVRRLFDEVWNQGNLGAIPEFIALNYVGHDAAEIIQGPDGYKAFVTRFRTAFPDLNFHLDDLIAEGDRVVVRYTAIGTNLGEFLGHPPTRNSGVVSGITIVRIESDKIVESWMSRDSLGLMVQLGWIRMPVPVHVTTAR